MANKRAATKEIQHPVAKKLKNDKVASSRSSISKGSRSSISEAGAKDPAPKLKYNTGSGVVLTCGQGDVGQLGLGPDIMEKGTFTPVPNLDNVVEIAVGGMHTVCLTEDGKVYTWGCNDEGALGREAEGDSEFEPQPVNLPKKAVQISAGDSHTVALLEDGSVFAWGSFRDSHGSMGLTGKGIEKTPVQLLGISGIIKICSGADHFAMLTSRGTVLTIGCPEQGQLGRVSQRSASRHARQGMMTCLTPGVVVLKRKRVDDVYAGVYNTFITSTDSSIYGFGLNNYFQLEHSELQEESNDPTNASSTCYFTPHLIRSLSQKKWSALATGQHHSLALNSEGKIYSFGRHDYGRLGLQNVSAPVTEPTLIPSLQDKKIDFVACGNCVSFAIDSEGVLYGWGMGTGYQLGNGKEDDILEPITIPGKQLKNYTVLQVASGGQHSAVLARRKQVNGNTDEKLTSKEEKSVA
uniref:Regulator of chromosome condensation n=1 Tax=Cacopsylla melanoneura TaxID=428564 RepID=A0A8D9FFW8_9HEMI